MIVVHLRNVQDPTPKATLTVTDDGQLDVSGQAELFDLDRVIRTPDGRALSMHDDVHEWARNLPHAYRSPYLLAEVIQDDTATN